MDTLKRMYSHLEYRYLFIILIVFSLLRLPSLFEPNWYGDEGIYQVLGNAINHGKVLYSQIWDNKPPLLYITYALVGADQFLIRFLSYLAGVFSVLGFYLLSKKLFSRTISLVTTFLFSILFALPMTEGNIANAENFMLVFIVFAALLTLNVVEDIHQSTSDQGNIFFKKLFVAGLLLGIAFLYKIVALFDFATFFLFILFFLLPKKISLNRETLSHIQPLFAFVLGFVLPILLTSLYFLLQGAFSDFVKATFFSNVSYVGYKNTFVIPQGLLLIKLLLLAVLIGILWKKRARLTIGTVFILLWFGFSVFNVYFSQRPYTHYVLVGIASYVLLLGLFLHDKKSRILTLILFLFFTVITITTFKLKLQKNFSYYQNFLSFVMNNKPVREYQAFFDSDVPRDNDIAQFVRKHKKDAKTMFLWGNAAQIYTLSDTLPPGRYTVAYHINSAKAISETEEAIRVQKPKFVILLPDSPLPQISLSEYTYRATIDDATIYESTF